MPAFDDEPASMKEDHFSFNNIFCIPHRDKYIVYFPLLQMILQGNKKFVNLLYQALNGDQRARHQLDIDDTFITMVNDAEKRCAHLKSVRQPPDFVPTSVSLFLTNDCTLRCRYCYAEGGMQKQHMPWKLVTGVLDTVLNNVVCSQSKQMEVHFHGGGDVSAAWKLLVQTREYLDQITQPKNIDVKTSIGLNGMLNAEQQQWIIHHIQSATISVDGPPDIHDKHRPQPNGKPSFRRVSETLKSFDNAKYKYGIRCTVTAESVHRLEEIVSFFCENFESRSIKLEPMFPRGRAKDSSFLPPQASLFVKNFRKAKRIAQKAGRELIYSGARLEILTNTFCQAAGESCAVTPDGSITSCYEVLDSSDPLAQLFFYGNYDYETCSFVVDDARRKKLFDLSVLHKPFCEKCFCKWHCAGDCPVKSKYAEIAMDGNIPDRCSINRELTKDQLIECLE
jgi:uncharacterized protein